MFTDDEKKRRVLARWIVGVFAVCSMIYLGMRHISAISDAVAYLMNLFMPLGYGLMLAMVLNAPMRFFERHLFRSSRHPKMNGIRRMLAILCSLICVIGIIVGVAVLVIPELVDAVTLVVQKLGGVLEQMEQIEASADWAAIPLGEYLSQIDIDWRNLRTRLDQWLSAQSGNMINGAIGIFNTAVNRIIDLTLSVIFAMYILGSKDKLKAQFTRFVRAWLPESPGEHLIHAAAVCNITFRQFIVGQTIEAVILGLLCTIGMLILRIPYAPTIGVLVGALALIPIAGAWAAAIIGAFLILTVNPFEAVVFLIFLLILQQLEGNLIYPRVVGSKIRLSAIWVLTAITVGGGLAGPLGMLLGVPAASAAYALLREATEKREEKKKNKRFSGHD